MKPSRKNSMKLVTLALLFVFCQLLTVKAAELNIYDVRYDQNGNLKRDSNGQDGGVCSPEHWGEALRELELDVYGNKGLASYTTLLGECKNDNMIETLLAGIRPTCCNERLAELTFLIKRECMISALFKACRVKVDEDVESKLKLSLGLSHIKKNLNSVLTLKPEERKADNISEDDVLNINKLFDQAYSAMAKKYHVLRISLWKVCENCQSACAAAGWCGSPKVVSNELSTEKICLKCQVDLGKSVCSSKEVDPLLAVLTRENLLDDSDLLKLQNEEKTNYLNRRCSTECQPNDQLTACVPVPQSPILTPEIHTANVVHQSKPSVDISLQVPLNPTVIQESKPLPPAPILIQENPSSSTSGGKSSTSSSSSSTSSSSTSSLKTDKKPSASGFSTVVKSSSSSGSVTTAKSEKITKNRLKNEKVSKPNLLLNTKPNKVPEETKKAIGEAESKGDNLNKTASPAAASQSHKEEPVKNSFELYNPVEWTFVGEEINSAGSVYKHDEIHFKFIDDGTLEGSINYEVDNSFMGPQKISFTGSWNQDGLLVFSQTIYTKRDEVILYKFKGEMTGNLSDTSRSFILNGTYESEDKSSKGIWIYASDKDLLLKQSPTPVTTPNKKSVIHITFRGGEISESASGSSNDTVMSLTFHENDKTLTGQIIMNGDNSTDSNDTITIENGTYLENGDLKFSLVIRNSSSEGGDSFDFLGKIKGSIQNFKPENPITLEGNVSDDELAGKKNYLFVSVSDREAVRTRKFRGKEWSDSSSDELVADSILINFKNDGTLDGSIHYSSNTLFQDSQNSKINGQWKDDDEIKFQVAVKSKQGENFEFEYSGEMKGSVYDDEKVLKIAGVYDRKAHGGVGNWEYVSQ